MTVGMVLEMMRIWLITPMRLVVVVMVTLWQLVESGPC